MRPMHEQRMKLLARKSGWKNFGTPWTDDAEVNRIRCRRPNASMGVVR
jgi:hypothetical protein